MYTDGMRRIKHNIQTYYRTRLFWFKNDNDKEKKFAITQHFVTDQLKNTNTNRKQKQDTKRAMKKDRQMDSLHGIGRLL